MYHSFTHPGRSYRDSVDKEFKSVSASLELPYEEYVGLGAYMEHGEFTNSLMYVTNNIRCSLF